MVIDGDEMTEAAVRECGEIGLAGNKAAHPSNGVFNTALLPRRVRVAEEGVDREAVQRTMAGEFGPIVEGDALTQQWRHHGKQIDEMTSDAAGCLAG